MRKFTLQEIKKFVSKPLFDEKIILNKDPSWPKISIVTPSFNQAEFLERTILSVLNQNYPNLEYIIIDGGSNDGSVDIIKKYEKYLAFWSSEKDKGQSDALNKGFKKATGDIFFYLASDDVLLPNILNKVAIAFMNKDIDVLYGNRLIIDPYDNIISERRCVRFLPYISKLGLLTLGSFAVYPDSMFYKREIFEKVNGFDLNLHNTMDTDFWLKIISVTKKIYFLREYIIGFRVTATSKTVSYWNDIRAKETEALFKKYGKPAFPKILGIIPYLIYLFLFVLQGDLDYIVKRVFKERRKKYFEYIK